MFYLFTSVKKSILFIFPPQWNDVISAFRQGVPRGRHRRYMRTAEDCFAGSSAVDWLLEHVKKRGDFGSNVTRYYPAMQICSQMLFKVWHIGMAVLAASAPEFCEKLSQVRLVYCREVSSYMNEWMKIYI